MGLSIKQPRTWWHRRYDRIQNYIPNFAQQPLQPIMQIKSISWSSSSNFIDIGGQNSPMSHTKQHKIPQDKIEWLKQRKIAR